MCNTELYGAVLKGAASINSGKMVLSPAVVAFQIIGWTILLAVVLSTTFVTLVFTWFNFGGALGRQGLPDQLTLY